MARVEGAQSPIHTPMLHSPTMPVRQIDHSPIRSLDGRWDALTAQTEQPFVASQLPAMAESQTAVPSSVHSPVHHSVEASMEATVEVSPRDIGHGGVGGGAMATPSGVHASYSRMLDDDGNTDGQHRGDGDNGGGGDGSGSGLSCARPISYGARILEKISLFVGATASTRLETAWGATASMGDRAFVTFRYAADAAMCVSAYRRHPLRGFGCCRPAAGWYHDSLRVSRAPEADDLIWPNLAFEADPHYRSFRPLLTMVKAAIALWLFAMVLQALTSDKLELAALGYISKEEPPTLSKWSEWLLDGPFYATNAALGAGLQYGLEVLVGFGEGAAASASLESRAVLFTSIFISLLVTLINTFLRRMLSASVDDERPPTLSRLELRKLTVIAMVYIINYTVVLLLVHSPLAGGRKNIAAVLGETFSSHSVNGTDPSRRRHSTVCGNVSAAHADLDLGVAGSAAYSCVSTAGDVLSSTFFIGVEGIVLQLGETGWYDTRPCASSRRSPSSI